MTTTDFDGLIAEALTQEEREFLAGLEEPSLIQQSLDLFRGRNRAFNILIAFLTAIFLALFVWCVVRFFQTEDIASMIRWGAGAFYCFTMIFGIKMWGWMEMQSNSIRREIKRVELQIVSLAHRVEIED